MKMIFSFLFTLSLMASVASANARQFPPYAWGESVNAEYHDYVEFIIKTDIPATSLLFSIEEYQDFECEVLPMNISKTEVSAAVYWSAGADFSGCNITLTGPNGEKFGTSTLYMTY